MPQHLDVIFEDENILAVYKPSGLIVHEDENEKQNTLINRVKAYLYKNGEYDPAVENSFAPALCHRLDRNTAGLVICAKNFATLQIMNEKIKNDEIEKHYRGLTCGVPRPARGTISTYLFKDEKNNQVYVCGKSHANAKSAITKYKVLGAKNNIALVDVNLITGRTHQIRVHFAHIGCPILGDNKYGSKEVNRKFRQKYQCLVAYKIKFNFQTDAGILNYLKDKIIELDEKFSCFDLK
jgi:23S rRNA pseudouridine955/2504/2580 synthase